MKNLIILISLFVSFSIAKSQDIIVLKDGRNINCNIVKEDSVNIYIVIKKNQQKIETIIPKEILKEIKYEDKNTSAVIELFNEKRNSISVFIGTSIATGEFKSDDISKESSGFAGNGLSVQLSYKYKFNSQIGISVKGVLNKNNFNLDKLADMISSSAKIKVTYNSVNYSYYGILAGPEFVLPVDKVSLNGHLLLGPSQLIEPEVSFTPINGAGWVKMTEINANALSYNIGAGFLYTINENWDIILNADYFLGSFEFGKYEMKGSNGQSQQIERGTQKYSTVTISAGIALKF